MKRLLCLAFLLAVPAWSITTVAQVLKNPDGTPFNGTITITLNASCVVGTELVWRGTSTVTINSIVATAAVVANTATVTTRTAHGFVAGQSVLLSGGTADTDLNGTYAVATVPTTATFTVTVANVTAGSYTESTLRATPGFTVDLYPNSTCTPSGTSYYVQYSSRGRTSQEFWIVTATTPTTIGDVRTAIAPTPSLSVAVGQLSQGGATTGQFLQWSGSAWGPTTFVTLANPMSAVGDLIYGGTSGAATRLAGNTAASAYFLSQTGTGSASQAPSWISAATARTAILGTVVAVAEGGTASSTAAGARTALGVPEASTALTDTANLVRNNASNAWSTGTQDMSAATATLPMKVGTTLPATCVVGEHYFKTNVTAGQNIYGCTSTNVWTVEAGGGAGGLTDPAANGMLSRTALNTTTARTITGTANEVDVTNGNGVSGNPTMALSATLDLSANTSTKPIKTGTSAPATCGVGEYFFDTDATAGQNTYACTATNTWTLQTAGGVANAAGAITQVQYNLDGTALGAEAAFTYNASTDTLTAVNLAGIIASAYRIRSFGASFDGGGSALTADKTVYVTVPYACTVQAWNILVDTGTATVDIWRAATGTAIPTVAGVITGSGAGRPAIAANTAIHSTTLTGWSSAAIAANDILGFHLEAVATATFLNFVVECLQ